MGMTVPGIDVSAYQRRVDWPRVTASGARFVYARCADGLRHPDALFAQHVAGARAQGLFVGAYLFVRLEQPLALQAEALLAAHELCGARRLPPALDLEHGSEGKLTAEETRAAARALVALVEERLGRPPVVYTCAGWWAGRMSPRDLGHCPLWVAHYGAKAPLMPPPWSRWHLWQHAGDEGRQEGVEGACDLDVWQGSERELEAWAEGVCR